VLESPSKRRIIVAGRQVGKTYMLALFALWWAFTRPDQTVLIIAPTLRQSKIVYERLRNIATAVPFISNHRIKDTLTETTFLGTDPKDKPSSIFCLPAGRTGEYLRGYPANLVIMDEAAFIPDKVFTAIRPAVAAVGGTIILSGTPFGEAGFFYETWVGENEKKHTEFKWQKFKIPSILSPLISEAFLEDERESGTMTEAEYSMEYEAEFQSDADEFFPKHLIKRALRDYLYWIVEPKDRRGIDDDKLLIRHDIKSIMPGDRIVGLDIARYGTDETAAVVVERLRDKTLTSVKRKTKLYKVIWSGTRRKQSVPESADWGREIMELFQAKAIIVDSTGVGGGAFDLLEREFGEQVEGVNFSVPVRRAMYNTLKIALEKENLILNMDDSKMFRQFGGYKLQKTDSATGEMKIKKDTTGHDDLVDALALAIWGYEYGRKMQPLDLDIPGDEEDGVGKDGEVHSPLVDELAYYQRLAKLENELVEEMNLSSDEKEKKKKKKSGPGEWGVIEGGGF